MSAPASLVSLRELVAHIDQLERSNAELTAAVDRLASEAAAYLEHWQAAQQSREAALATGLRAAGELSVRDHAIARLEEQLGLVGRECDEHRAALTALQILHAAETTKHNPLPLSTPLEDSKSSAL